MYSLNLPLIRLRADSQRLGDGGLTGRVAVWEGNGDDAFLFWATCSTGTSMVTGGSTGAAGRRVDPVVDDRGVDACVGNTCLGPVLVVLVGEEGGLRLPDGPGPATGGLATSFGPPWTSLEAPGWAGGGTKDGTATEGNTELGQLSKGRQHRPQGGGERNSASFQLHVLLATANFGLWLTIV